MNETSINLRLSEDLKNGIEALAEAQNRSVNNLIVTILEDYVKGIADRVLEYFGQIMNLSEVKRAELASRYAVNTVGKEKEDGKR